MGATQDGSDLELWFMGAISGYYTPVCSTGCQHIGTQNEWAQDMEWAQGMEWWGTDGLTLVTYVAPGFGGMNVKNIGGIKPKNIGGIND